MPSERRGKHEKNRLQGSDFFSSAKFGAFSATSPKTPLALRERLAVETADEVVPPRRFRGRLRSRTDFGSAVEARGTPRDHPTGRAGRVDDVSTASAVGLGRGAGADVWCRGTLQALA